MLVIQACKSKSKDWSEKDDDSMIVSKLLLRRNQGFDALQSCVNAWDSVVAMRAAQVTRPVARLKA